MINRYHIRPIFVSVSYAKHPSDRQEQICMNAIRLDINIDTRCFVLFLKIFINGNYGKKKSEQDVQNYYAKESGRYP